MDSCLSLLHLLLLGLLGGGGLDPLPADAQTMVQYPILLWTEKTSRFSKIRGIGGQPRSWISPQSDFRYVKSRVEIDGDKYGVAYNHVTEKLYWSDKTRNAIYSQPVQETLSLRNEVAIETVIQERVTIGSGGITAITLDWHTENIYYIMDKRITVASSRGGATAGSRTLFSSNLDNPIGITVDPQEGKIFWTDSGTTPKIELGRTWGEGRQLLRSQGLERPLGVTAVVQEQRVYWVDAGRGTVESMDYAGDAHKELVTGRAGQDMFGIAVYEEYMFVTTGRNVMLMVFAKEDGKFVAQYEIDTWAWHITMATPKINIPEHECSKLGCTQICLNKAFSGGACACRDGYFLSANRADCRQLAPKYIYSTGPGVRSIDANLDAINPRHVTLHDQLLVGSQQDVRALAYFYREQRLYYADTGSDVIYTGFPAQKSYEEVTVNTRHVEGMAVDWSLNRVYWADKTLRHIMMSELDGRFHSILMTSEKAGTPTGIAVDARARLLFWNDAAESGAIYRANLDGSEHKLLAKIDGHPQGIFVDPHNKRVYWADESRQTVECVLYTGRGRRTVHSMPRHSVYDVTVYQELTVWTDQHGGLNFTHSSGDEITTRWQGRSAPLTTTYDVIAFDSYLQPPIDKGLCANNGGCAQHCYVSPEGAKTCSCAIGYTLNTDGRSCDSEIKEQYFLLITDPYHKQFYQMNLDGATEPQGVPIPAMNHPISVDYASGRYYWIDSRLQEFKSSNDDGSRTNTLMSYVSEGMAPVRLVVDPTREHIYFTDSAARALYRMTLGGEALETMVTNIDDPRGVAYDHMASRLYWTTNVAVETAEEDGSGRRTILTDLRRPEALTVYPQDQMLYVGERETGRIIAYNTSSEQVDILFRNRSLGVIAIAASHQFLFFTTYNEKSVYRVDREDGANLTVVGPALFARLTDIRVVEELLGPTAATEDGFNWFVIIGAAAAALFLAILLLVALLAIRHRRRRRQPKDTSSDTELTPPSDTGFDPVNEVDHQYTYFNNSTLFDIRASHEGMNGKGETSGNTPNGTPGNAETLVNGTPNGTPNGKPNGALNGAVVAGGAVAAVAAIPAVARRKARYKTKKGDPGFQFGEKDVGTKLQRLAKRLRNGLSSIRWSGTESTPAAEEVTFEKSPQEDRLDAPRNKPLPKALVGPVIPQLHQMPRGFAPASRVVPSNVRTTWNKGKVADDANKEETEPEKQMLENGVQVMVEENASPPPVPKREQPPSVSDNANSNNSNGHLLSFDPPTDTMYDTPLEDYDTGLQNGQIYDSAFTVNGVPMV